MKLMYIDVEWALNVWKSVFATFYSRNFEFNAHVNKDMHIPTRFRTMNIGFDMKPNSCALIHIKFLFRYSPLAFEARDVRWSCTNCKPQRLISIKLQFVPTKILDNDDCCLLIFNIAKHQRACMCTILLICQTNFKFCIIPSSNLLCFAHILILLCSIICICC